MNYTILQDSTDPCTWVRQVRVMAGKPEDLNYPIPPHATTKRYTDELNLFHLDASWPLREVVSMASAEHAGAYWTFAAWWLGNQRVSAAIAEAGKAFELAAGVSSQVALIKRIPENTQEWVEVNGICLVRADWVPERFLVVTAAGMWRGLPGYQKIGAKRCLATRRM